MRQNDIQELFLLRMSLKAIRDRVNQDLDALAEKVDAMIPEKHFKQRKRVTDWKKEVRRWKF